MSVMDGKLKVFVALVVTALFCSSSVSQIFDVQIRGEVEFNLVTNGVLGNVSTGDEVLVSFQLDSSNFVDSANFPTRGYVIDEFSFLMDFGSGNSLGLQDGMPATSFFVLRDNDPAVDGFFLSTNLNFPNGLALEQAGQFGQFSAGFMVTYGGKTLPSLDIGDAAGSYGFKGLSVFNFVVDDGPFSPLGILFESMSISAFEVCDFEIGDVNEDGNVNLLDVVPFVDLLSNGNFVCQADINMDGRVDLLDVVPFVQLLAGN